MTRKVLVTGANGFVGRDVAKNFGRAGWLVVGIGHGSLSNIELTKLGISSWHTADITLDSLVTYAGEPDVIVHCAGSGSVAFSMEHPYQDFMRTVSSTAAVLEYMRLYAPHASLIYPSSAAVYGVATTLPIHESELLHPVSPYGVNKLVAENLCQSYARNYGIAVAIVRFFSIYGEGLRKQLLWDACSKIIGGDDLFFGSGAELRDWVHVDDAARLMYVATQHASVNCPIVNGGTGVSVAVSEILVEIFREYGTTMKPRFIGNPRLGDPPGYCADVAAAACWGWSPTINWRQGVRRYVEWFKESIN